MQVGRLSVVPSVLPPLVLPPSVLPPVGAPVVAGSPLSASHRSGHDNLQYPAGTIEQTPFGPKKFGVAASAHEASFFPLMDISHLGGNSSIHPFVGGRAVGTTVVVSGV